jgi:hypothetical protein
MFALSDALLPLMVPLTVPLVASINQAAARCDQSGPMTLPLKP